MNFLFNLWKFCTQMLWLFTEIFVVVLGSSASYVIVSHTCAFNYVISTWVLQRSESSLSRKLADQGRCQKRINLILFPFIYYKMYLPKLWRKLAKSDSIVTSAVLVESEKRFLCSVIHLLVAAPSSLSFLSHGSQYTGKWVPYII